MLLDVDAVFRIDTQNVYKCDVDHLKQPIPRVTMNSDAGYVIALCSSLTM